MQDYRQMDAEITMLCARCNSRFAREGTVRVFEPHSASGWSGGARSVAWFGGTHAPEASAGCRHCGEWFSVFPGEPLIAINYSFLSRLIAAAAVKISGTPDDEGLKRLLPELQCDMGVGEGFRRMPSLMEMEAHASEVESLMLEVFATVRAAEKLSPVHKAATLSDFLDRVGDRLSDLFVKLILELRGVRNRSTRDKGPRR